MTDNLYNGSRLTAHGSRLTGEDSIQFSIIVPVYNCEKYLIKCLDSLCNQDIFTLTNSRNYEIIIVDDGSTDKSGEICDSYAEKFSFIHVTHTENHGVAHARNVALKQCQGNYIMFSDPDDFVSPQLMSVITRALELDNQADMLVFKHFEVKEFDDKNWPVYDINNMKTSDLTYHDNEDFCFYIITDDLNVGGFPWNKVTKKEILQGKYFNESLYVMSDQPYFLDVMCSHKNMRICSMNYYLYCYVWHSAFGLTRLPHKYYNKKGINRFIISMESELNIKGLPSRVIDKIKNDVYIQSLGNLRRPPFVLSKEARTQLISNMNKCFFAFYRSPKHSLIVKLKSFIKHVLLILRII